MTTPALRILWPAFLGAALLEMVVFGVVDPHEIRYFGRPPLSLPPTVLYSITFLIFWCVIAGAGALTALLDLSARQLNERGTGVDGSERESS